MKRFFAIMTIVIASWTHPSTGSADDHDCTKTLEAIPLCSILANAGQYDGKEVLTRATYRMVVHGSILKSSDCSDDLVNLRGAPGTKDNKEALAIIRTLTKKNQFRPVNVVVRGLFHVAHQNQCFGQNCLRYELENATFICATISK